MIVHASGVGKAERSGRSIKRAQMSKLESSEAVIVMQDDIAGISIVEREDSRRMFGRSHVHSIGHASKH